MDSNEDIDLEKQIKKIKQEERKAILKLIFSILLFVTLGITMFVFRWMGSRRGGGDKDFLSISAGIDLVNSLIIGIYMFFCIKKKYKTKLDLLTKKEPAKKGRYKLNHIILGIISLPVYVILTAILYKLFFSQYLLSVISGGITSWLLFIGSLFEGYRKYYKVV